jgi:hypothetical protein
MHVTVDHRALFKAHLLCIFSLVLIYAALNAFSLASGHRNLLGLLALFNLDGEHNAPALFSFVALLFAAVIAWSTGTIQQNRGIPFGRHWHALAGLLFYLAADEACEIHENISIVLRTHYELFGRWQHSWVLAYAMALAVLGTLFIPFLRRLPRDTCWEMIGAGGLFVAGGMGIEFLWGLLDETLSSIPVAADLFEVAVEESAEMLGVALLIRAVLKYATRIQHAPLLGTATPVDAHPVTPDDALGDV